jgi:hypothetical protein
LIISWHLNTIWVWLKIGYIHQRAKCKWEYNDELINQQFLGYSTLVSDKLKKHMQWLYHFLQNFNPLCPTKKRARDCAFRPSRGLTVLTLRQDGTRKDSVAQQIAFGWPSMASGFWTLCYGNWMKMIHL